MEAAKKEHKELTRKYSEANQSVANLNHDIQRYQKHNKSLQTSLSKATEKIEQQSEAKYARDIEIEKLKLSQEEQKAIKATASIAAKEKHSEDTHHRRLEILEMKSEIRIHEKEKSEEQKVRAKQQNFEDHRQRLDCATTAMQRTMNTNGGSFRDMTSVQDVSPFYLLFNFLRLINILSAVGHLAFTESAMCSSILASFATGDIDTNGLPAY